MKIALLGGTGDIGEGLALRWADETDHEVLIGSRDPDRAAEKAAEYERELDRRDVECTIRGFGNPEAASRGDVVVLSVPAYHVSDTIVAVADGLDSDTVLVSPAVGMKRDDDGMHYHRPSAGSVTAVAAKAAPEDVPVVGAFHNLAAGRLADLDAELGVDTLLIGDDPDAKERVRRLADAVEGLRPLDAGPLANAPEIEGLTPLMINVGRYNEGLHDLGVSFR